MYIKQRMGAPHAVCRLKSTTYCVLLSHKMYKITQKITKNPGFKGVYQRLGITNYKSLLVMNIFHHIFLRQNKEKSHFIQESTSFKE